MPTTVAILPLPLTPASLFGYGILRFLGQISEQTDARFTRVSNPQADFFSCDRKIVDLRVHEGILYSQVLKLVESNPSLRRVLSFATFGDNQEMHKELESVLQKLNMENSYLALPKISELVSMLVENRHDIWKAIEVLEAEVDELKLLPTTALKRLSCPTKKRGLWIPVYEQRGGKTADKPYGSEEVTLREGRICSLEETHIGIVVGGPPSSGKSTLAVRLVSEMRRCIESLYGWDFPDLKVTVSHSTVDLDRGTPTSKEIHKGHGQDRDRLENLKQPWNTKLARMAQREFFESRARCNIVVADLPGLVTDITKLLVAPADAAIIIAKDEDWGLVRQEWIPLMKGFGVPIFSRIRNCRAKDGFWSTPTLWRKGKQLNGRVVGLDRTDQADFFIQYLVQFLLFDILPAKFGEEDIT